MKPSKTDKSFFELKIQGKIAEDVLSTENFDISKFKELLDDAETIIRKPLSDNYSKENISFKYEDGCIRIKFLTSIFVINSLFADLNEVIRSSNIFNIEKNRATVISKWQNHSKSNNEFSYSIIDSQNKCLLKIDANTNYVIPAPVLNEVEVILYGEITDIGGKSNPNIHIDTDNGSFKVSCNRKDIINDNEKRLYTVCGIKVKAHQDINTFEISKDNIHFIEFIPYANNLQSDILKKYIAKGTKAWKNIKDSVEWKRNLRDNENK